MWAGAVRVEFSLTRYARDALPSHAGFRSRYCDLERSTCECEKDAFLHGSDSDWTLHMSLQDVFLFLVQDLQRRASVNPEDMVPCREHTARRFNVSVTSDLLSSYVMREQEE